MRVRSVLPSVLIAVGTAACAGGSGGGEPASGLLTPAPAGVPGVAARAELAARAAAAQELAMVGAYTLTTPGRRDRTVMVVRAADGSWRVDIPAGGRDRDRKRVDVAVLGGPDGRYHCRPDDRSDPAGCAPAADGVIDIDPPVHRLFADWPGVLTDRAAAVSVQAAAGSPAPAESPVPAEPSASPEPSGSPGTAADTACFAVEPTTASLAPPVAAGTYCYRADGLLTSAALTFGSLTLSGTGTQVPPTVELPE